MAKVVITVSGGCAQVIQKPENIVVEIRDYDVEGSDVEDNPNVKQDDDGELYQEMICE